MTDWFSLLQTFIAAVLGGLVVHFLTLSRERAAKRRELMSDNLRRIWNDLDQGNRPENEKELARIEGAISGIQLFGSDEAIRVANNLIVEFRNSGKLDTSELIVILRSELRKELGLTQSNQPYVHFRAKAFLRDKK